MLLGLFAGGMFCIVLADSLSRLPGPAYVRYWQALNSDYSLAMPVLLLSATALLLLTCVLSYRRGRLVFGFTVAALLLVGTTIALSVSQLNPLNQLADTWDADAPPPDWTDVRDRWWDLHAVRTVVAVLAFAGLLLAQAVDRGRAGGVAADIPAARPARVAG